MKGAPPLHRRSSSVFAPSGQLGQADACWAAHLSRAARIRQAQRVDKLLLLVQLLVTVYLTGLIWTIGVVHYPLFNMADRANFSAFEAAHSARISSIVLLPMLLELGLSVAMALNPSSIAPNWAAWLGLALVILIWASTFLLQVPQHAALSSDFDQQAFETLVSTNWIRVVLWSARSVLLAWLVCMQLR